MRFKHFLATRFNLRVDEWKKTRNGQLPLSEQWMKERLRLFEQYCLPSVLNQSNKNFSWCIFMDTVTSEADKKKILELVEPFPFIQLFFIDGINELKPRFIRHIQSDPEDFDFAITTRLDNDDLLHQNFINAVQQTFLPQHDTAIDLRCGFQAEIGEEGVAIKDYYNPFNQFGSLIEKRDKVETVFNKWHKDLKYSENVIVNTSGKFWIELVHDGNYANAIMPRLPLTTHFNERDFGIKGKIRLRRDHRFYSFFVQKAVNRLTRKMKNTRKKMVSLTFGKAGK